jgi:hypothetical protein
MAGVSQRAWGGALEALDKASELVRKRFPQLLYGKVFVTPNMKGTRTVAMYTPAKDVLYLSLLAQKATGDVQALCHEFGHRYDHRFWRDHEAKQEFMNLSTETVYETIPVDKKEMVTQFLKVLQSWKAGRKDMGPKLLQQYLAEINKNHSKQRVMRDLAQAALSGGPAEEKALRDKFLELGPDEIVTDKVLRGPLSVTPYGATDWKENFCEAFSFYLVGKPLPSEIQSFMERLK